jgi:tetratricopeptide (TPR) repeat protein
MLSSQLQLISRRLPLLGALSVTVNLAFAIVVQSPPNLPGVKPDDFAPNIRAQVKQALDQAQAEPRDAKAAGRLGMILQTYEQHELAAACYERARRLAPTAFEWTYYLGTTQAALGRHREAAQSFREALRLRPDYVPAQIRLADALLAANLPDEGAPFYEAALKRAPGSAQAHYGLGRVKAARRELEAAAAHYRRALELFPNYGAAHYALALALRDLGQADKAREQLALYQKTKLFKPPSNDPLMSAVADLNLSAADFLARGVRLEAEGKLAESVSEHLRALEANPQTAQAHVNLISLYGRLGEFDKAEEHYRAAVATDANLADAHYDYGVMLAGGGRRRRTPSAARSKLTRSSPRRTTTSARCSNVSQSWTRPPGTSAPPSPTSRSTASRIFTSVAFSSIRASSPKRSNTSGRRSSPKTSTRLGSSTRSRRPTSGWASAGAGFSTRVRRARARRRSDSSNSWPRLTAT